MYGRLSKGDQAELRRGTMGRPFWQLLDGIGKADARPDNLKTWRLLIQLVAIGGYARTPFGVALNSAGYSELRLQRLLDADCDQLKTLLRRTAKQLRSAGKPANWNTIRRLLFDYNGEGEQVRLQIAQEYFTYTSHSSDDTTSNE